MDEGTWELSVAKKPEAVLRTTLHQDISLIFVFYFFSQTNLTFFIRNRKTLTRLNFKGLTAAKGSYHVLM